MYDCSFEFDVRYVAAVSTVRNFSYSAEEKWGFFVVLDSGSTLSNVYSCREEAETQRLDLIRQWRALK